MFERIGRLAERRFVWVVAGWAILAGLLNAVAPTLDEVATFDETAFLSADAQSLRAARLLERDWPEDEYGKSGAIVFAREPRLRESDHAYARELDAWLRGPEAPRVVEGTQSIYADPDLARVLVSKDGAVTIMVVAFETPPFEPPTNEAVEEIRRHIARGRPEGLAVHVTGNAGVGADQDAAIQESVERTTIITLVLVVLILLWIFRSPVTPLVPLVTIGVAFAVARALIALLGQAGMDISSLVETFMVVIVFGAGTDYCLFIISRFREDVARSHEYRRTLVGTMLVVGAVIASSAGTVIVGFVSQGVAEFGMFRTTGPAMAVAVLVVLAAGLTLTPALMRAFGRNLFWPAHPDRRAAEGRLPEIAAEGEVRGRPRRPAPVAGAAEGGDPT